MINYDRDIKGSFNTLSEQSRELIMEIVSNFHFRDGTVHNDNSTGTIKITTKQINDCLAYMIMHKNKYQTGRDI